jgi:hypothetical protein
MAKIFVVNRESEATVKAFKVEHAYEADLLVFVVKGITKRTRMRSGFMLKESMKQRQSYFGFNMITKPNLRFFL